MGERRKDLGASNCQGSQRTGEKAQDLARGSRGSHQPGQRAYPCARRRGRRSKTCPPGSSWISRCNDIIARFAKKHDSACYSDEHNGSKSSCSPIAPNSLLFEHDNEHFTQGQARRHSSSVPERLGRRSRSTHRHPEQTVSVMEKWREDHAHCW
jgi:hypothetical protein